MINGFEKYTGELTDEERKTILPLTTLFLMEALDEEKALTNKLICQMVFNQYGIKTTQPRIRKVIHEIRVNGYLNCLMSNSKGYFITTDPDKLESYVDSLKQRINSISDVHFAMSRDLNNITNDQTRLF